MKTQVSTLVGAGVGGILVASLLGATPWRSGPSSVHGGSGGFAGSSSARRVRGLGAGEEVGAAAPENNVVESDLVVWAVASSAQVERGLGAGGEVGAAAPMSTNVLWSVGSGRVDGRVVDSYGVRPRGRRV